jgi:hypothetical protein
MAYYSGYFNIDLMQFRLDNTGGHISPLGRCFFGFLLFNYCKGIDLSEIVTGYLFFNLVNKSSVTPFKKVHKIMGNQQIKTSKIITKTRLSNRSINHKISQSSMIV